MRILFELEKNRIRLSVVENTETIETSEWLYDRWREEMGRFLKPYGKFEECWYLASPGATPNDRPVEKVERSRLSRHECTKKYFSTADQSASEEDLLDSAVLPEAGHWILDDGAFFSALPIESRTYAIPARFRKAGIVKRGEFGLTHQWVDSMLRKYGAPGIRKVVSVFLGDRTNVAAVRDGGPVETSIGFSPAEGLPSLTGSGDLDPTILIELHAQGMGIHEISDLVRHKSGIQGYLGRDIGFREFLQDGSGRAAALREIFLYQIVKYIGFHCAILGGIDALTFVSDAPGADGELVAGVCEWLGFLGIDVRDLGSKPPERMRKISREGSSVPVYYFSYNKIRIISDLLEEARTASPA